MNKKRSPWILLVVATFSMIVATVFFPEPSAGSDLENECTDYRTYLDQSPGLTGDFSRCSRARCPRDVFDKIRKKNGFDQSFDSSKVSGWSSCPEAWWTPPEVGVYVKKLQSDVRELLAYKEGYIYYDISAW